MPKKRELTRKIFPVEIRKGGKVIAGERVGTISYDCVGEGVVTEDFVKGLLSFDSKEHVIVVVSGEHKIYVALEKDVVPIEV